MSSQKLPVRNASHSDVGGEEKLEKEEELIPENVPIENVEILQEMMKAGLMYGHKKSKTDPKFKQYIFTTRNGIEVIDLSQTIQALESAIKFLKTKIKDGGSVLIVATQPAARGAIEELAKKFNFSFINERWIGGLLTNFRIISARIDHYKRLKADFEKGNLERYTKKERVMISREIERMSRMFIGLENLMKLPDVMIIIDPSIKSHATALHEAHMLNIPVVSVVDSDDNPEKVDYPIPANDHTKSGIEWLVKKITEGLETKN